MYCLAVFAARYGIAVHVAVLMSTHEHLLVTDVRGELPLFIRDFHRTIASCVKALHGWKGPLWDQQRTSIVQLMTPEAIIETAAYMIANPVSAGLVSSSTDWPGVTVSPSQIGRGRWTLQRPKVYFSRNNPTWPETATLELSLPEQMPMSDTDLRTGVADQVAQFEAAAAADMRARGLTFLGANLATQCSPYERAKSDEPARGRNPTFAVGKGQKEALLSTVRAVRAFRQAYREAFDQWRDGVRDVAFPPGTWLMPRLHCAQVEPIPQTLAHAC
jgi:putative transposase